MLELKKIIKDYNVGEDKVRALKGIDLAFRENEMVAILGQSGCGKTTLLNIIGGLDGYTDGDLIIDGRSTKFFKSSDWDAYRNQKIGFVFQSYNLISHLTVLGNVELALTLSGIKKAERRERAIEALRRVGLEGEIKKRPNQLSGGQMQRVAIARAIVNNPEIVLADEPTGALDSDTGITVMEILKEIAKDRLVIMVTHNRELAEKYSTRIISMLDGEVVNDSAPVEFATRTDDFAESGEEDSDDSDLSETSEKAKAEQIKLERKQLKKRQAEITKANRAALKRTSMNFITALGLSWRNLITKKGRTLATAVAGSIGIIGVALVLALSNGFNMYIEDMQTSMLANFPVTASQMSLDMETTMDNMNDIHAKLEKFPDGNKLIINPERAVTTYHYNRITPQYIEHINNMPSGIAVDVLYSYAKTKIVLSEHMASGYGLVSTANNDMSNMIGTNSSNFQTLLNNSDYVLSQYDVLQGKYPTEANELAVIIGTDNSINASVLKNSGLKIPDNIDDATLDDLIGQSFKYVHNNEWFTYDDANGLYKSFNKSASQDEWKALYDDPHNLTLKVVGVMRLKESASLGLFNTGVVYTPALTAHMLEDGKNSEVAKAQRARSGICVSDAFSVSLGKTTIDCIGLPFANISAMLRLAMPSGMLDSEITENDLYESALQALGASDMPTNINFYPVTFSLKTDMINYLYEYNSGKEIKDKVLVLDAASMVTESVSDMIDIISYVLIAFAAISLVVSSVMISIITYASVVERTKEIGVLRAVGARKTDIMRVFNAETIIIGFAAGLIGVLVTFIVSFPLSAIFKSISDGMITTSLVVLAWWHALLLVAVSVLLTLVAGMLPARAASKKDPVVALRTE